LDKFIETKILTVLAATLATIKQYCAYQERCHSEVRNKLLELGCYGEDLEAAIGLLIEENFLNEERFAIAFAGGKFRMQSWGKVKIRLHLKQKQVSEYCIGKGLKSIDDNDYYNRLKALYEKKEQALDSEKNEWRKRQKITAYLLQKGYESDLIQQVWNSDESM